MRRRHEAPIQRAIQAARTAAGQPAATSRAPKYNAKRTEYAGQVYDSKAEAAYAQHLDLQLAAGQIAGWRRGRTWVLVPSQERRYRITWRLDFEVWAGPDDEGLIVVDVKGMQTREARLKAILWHHVYPHIPLYLWQKGKLIPP